MTQLEEYFENATVLDIDWDVDKEAKTNFQESCILQVRNNTVKCFIPAYYSNHLSESFKIGKTYKVKLELVTNVIEKTTTQNTSIKKLDEKGWMALTKIQGRIIAIIFDQIIVDCGAYVVIKLNQKDHFKEGDYVQSNGRLDVQKV